MTPFLENLKRQAEENPVVAIAVTAALVTATSKLLDSSTNARNARAWNLEVQRRAMKDALKK